MNFSLRIPKSAAPTAEDAKALAADPSRWDAAGVRVSAPICASLTERARAYLARRIVRATNPTTRKRLEKQADSDTRKMVEVMPALLSKHCIATADDLAIQHARNSK